MTERMTEKDRENERDRQREIEIARERVKKIDRRSRK